MTRTRRFGLLLVSILLAPLLIVPGTMGAPSTSGWHDEVLDGPTCEVVVESDPWDTYRLGSALVLPGLRTGFATLYYDWSIRFCHQYGQAWYEVVKDHVFVRSSAVTFVDDGPEKEVVRIPAYNGAMQAALFEAQKWPTYSGSAEGWYQDAPFTGTLHTQSLTGAFDAEVRFHGCTKSGWYCIDAVATSFIG